MNGVEEVFLEGKDFGVELTDLMLFYKGIDLLLINFSSPSNCILL